MEKGISYLNRDFEDYKNALMEYTKKYYPDLFSNISEASIGSWLIDLNASVADNLSYHIDRAFQETNIDSAHEKESVMSIARSNGVKIPGPKGAMAEVKFTCQLPVGRTFGGSQPVGPDMRYAPVIKKGTKVSSSNQVFELLYDVDFSKICNVYGVPDFTRKEVRDSNNDIVRYEVTKIAVVVAGESRIYSKRITSDDVYPFMNITINGDGIMNVESIITKEGDSFLCEPTDNEFFIEDETDDRVRGLTRFFEVNSLSQQERWGVGTINGSAIKKEYAYEVNGETIPAYSVTKGEWKPVKHKFMTEYNDNGSLKIIFGSGMDANVDGVDYSTADDFSKFQISKILKNGGLGYLPNKDSMLYVLYRVGGGHSSNVPKGDINNISYLNYEVGGNGSINENVKNSVISTISVESTTPSVSGKDMPSVDEMKGIVKYYNAAQERCVTVKDYKSRILQLPPEFGAPYRVGVSEENNKIMVYLLGLDYNGNLAPEIPDAIISNIKEYLKNYRMINDFVEIKSGRVVNVSFEVNVHVLNSYTTSYVKNEITKTIKEYMDTKNREMGDDIYVGDLAKEICKVDGVMNLISLDVYNEIGDRYSNNMITQPVYNEAVEDRYHIDLSQSENILYSDGDTMIEVKYPKLGEDIKIEARVI